MNIIGVPLSFLKQTCKRIGITLQVQRVDDEGDVKCRLWPIAGKQDWRAQSLNGRFRVSLCYHVQHYFMLLVFQEYPEAEIVTYYMRWNKPLFDAGALAWSKNEIASKATEVTCACDPSTIDLCFGLGSEENDMERGYGTRSTTGIKGKGWTGAVDISLLASTMRKSRDARDFSQREVARQVKITPTTLSRIENAVGIPDADIIQKCANWLGVPVSMFIRGKDKDAVTYFPSEPLPSIIDAHLRRDKTLSAESAEALSEIFTKAYELALLSSKGQQKGKKR
jgi:transcriptional regulator with XRE-family HTH domain